MPPATPSFLAGVELQTSKLAARLHKGLSKRAGHGRQDSGSGYMRTSSHEHLQWPRLTSCRSTAERHEWIGGRGRLVAAVRAMLRGQPIVRNPAVRAHGSQNAKRVRALPVKQESAVPGAISLRWSIFHPGKGQDAYALAPVNRALVWLGSD